MENKPKITDEELSKRTSDAIDEIGVAVKSAARKFFDACVERTADVFSEMFDKYSGKAKEKIKGDKNDKET
jgi:hypothetical protein